MKKPMLTEMSVKPELPSSAVSRKITHTLDATLKSYSKPNRMMEGVTRNDCSKWDHSRLASTDDF